MKHILKVASLQNLPSTRPIIAMDDEGNLFGEGLPVGPTIEMVDLGLTSHLKWAKYNLGASSETEYGDYYQWAAITPLSVSGTTVDPAADWSLCPYTDDGNTFTKYTGSDYSTLQTEDDIVAIQFTGYRMPTKEDFEELIAGTTQTWTLDYKGSGIHGRIFKSKTNDNEIFFPTAGYCSSSLNGVDTIGYYWSSSLDIDAANNAWRLYIASGSIGISRYNRYLGFSVRPVSQ